MTDRLQHIALGLALFASLALTGCTKPEKITFAPQNAEFAIDIPIGWRYADKAESLKALGDDMQTKLKNIQIKAEPVLVLKAPQGGLVVLQSEAMTAPERLDPGEHKKFLAGMAAQAGMTRGVKEEINGVPFFVSTNTMESSAIRISALTEQNDRVYAIAAGVPPENAESNAKSILAVLRSISFDPEAVKGARAQHEARAAGFVTGLWQGALLPFRAISALFTKINIVEKHNKGTEYWIGYIVGIGILIMVLVPKRAKPTPPAQTEPGLSTEKKEASHATKDSASG